MVVNNAKDVGLHAVVRVGHGSGQPREEKVIAVFGDNLILDSGMTVDPRKHFVKVVASPNGNWRAVENGEAVDRGPEDNLGYPASQKVSGSWPGSR